MATRRPIPSSLAPVPGRWRFGAAVLDEQRATLQVDGGTVDLDRSSYDVLLALLRHAGEVATKDELLEAGWPDRVVSENSLAKAISRLRQALGEAGRALKAVHGYGYRLALPVAFEPLAVEAREAQPHLSERLREGDRLPHHPGWRLTRRLGQGSAGVIFLATAEDGQTRAIKLATSEAGLRCLKREIGLSRYIQAVKPGLAGVAPVLGSHLGQPPFFLEMPYYPHGNLGEWATAQGGLPALALEQRLALCADLCEAVAALHEIGIIHKDLKPDNVFPVPDPDRPGRWRLVLADLGAGQAQASPRLRDLGITMSVADPGLDAASPQAGSLLYLAPEVIAGDMPTQRSDVYALGVLLFQLATGDLRRAPAPGWEAAIDDPLLREDIANAAALEPRLRSLDAGSLADRLRTLPERREARAQAERHRQQLDVRTRQLERARRRRRLWGAVAATLAVGLLGTSTMFVYAERARRVAEENAHQRQAVLDFVTRDILAQADPYATRDGSHMSVREAVDRAADNVATRLSADPAAAAAVHAIVANAYFGQDRHDRAIAHFRQARALYRKLGPRHRASLVPVETGLCDVHRIAFDLRAAAEACREALRHARATGQGLALAALKNGQLLTEQGRYAQAEAVLRPLLASPAIRDDAKALGELHWSLGLCARGQGHYTQARDHFSRLLTLYREAGEHSTWTAWAYNSLGSVLVETGDYAEAEPLLQDARRIFLETQGPGQVEAQMPNIWRVESRLRQGQWASAIELLQSQRQDWAATLKPTHPLRLKAEASLAWAEAMSGDAPGARRRLQAALDDRETVFGTRQGRIAHRTLRWARAALALDATGEAGRLLDMFDAQAASEVAAPHPLLAEAQCLRAELDWRRGDAAAAVRHARRCERQLQPFLPDSHHPLRREAAALLGPVNAIGIGHAAPGNGFGGPLQ